MSTLARRRTRVMVSFASALLAVLLASQATLAAVSWTAPVKASAAGTYSFGSALARTATTTTSYLHQQYTNDAVTNPGVYYRRGNATGSTWGTQVRMNPSGGFAENGTIAASSKYVYVAYQVIGSWDNFDPTAARQINVRINTNHGASTAWLANKTISAVTRVGRPAAAAAGAYGYVVYTDADTGDIVFTRNGGVNNDSGWTAQNIGITASIAPDNNGLDGYPVVAAYGASVMVAWVSAADGSIVAKISTDYGSTWPPDTTLLRTGDVWDLSAAAAAGRFGIAWADASGIRTKLFRNGAWQAAKTVAAFSSTGTWRAGYGTAISLAGTTSALLTGRVGVAWSACSRADCTASSTGTKGVSVLWRESTDNIATWKAVVTVASYGFGTSRRINDYPSVVMTSLPRRFILYNTATWNLGAYANYLKVGSGTP